MNALSRKHENYLSWIKAVQDRDGFIESSECDSLLFSGLVGCVPGIQIDLDKAFDRASGQWHRRPCDRPCFPEHSKSTISRDMLLGVLWYAYFNKRLDITEQLIKHALRNFGLMGQAVDLKTTVGRCLISPGLLSTAAWISYRLGGPSRPWLRYLPQSESSSVIGFQAHLSVLHILLRQLVTGKKTYGKILEKHYNRNSFNPLFCAAVGRYDEARTILMHEAVWPKDRLPTSEDRKEPWVLQREYGKDWWPTIGPAHTHSGGDFLFCHWLIEQLER